MVTPDQNSKIRYFFNAFRVYINSDRVYNIVKCKEIRSNWEHFGIITIIYQKITIIYKKIELKITIFKIFPRIWLQQSSIFLKTNLRNYWTLKFYNYFSESRHPNPNPIQIRICLRAQFHFQIMFVPNHVGPGCRFIYYGRVCRTFHEHCLWKVWQVLLVKGFTSTLLRKV